MYTIIDLKKTFASAWIASLQLPWPVLMWHSLSCMYRHVVLGILSLR
jgi:hypothetical protein